MRSGAAAAVAAVLVGAAIMVAGCGDDEDSEVESVGIEQPPASSPKASDPPPDKPASAKGAVPDAPTPTPAPAGEPSQSKADDPPERAPDSSGPASERVAVTRVIRTYLSSIGAGDGSKACAQFTKGGRKAKLAEIARIAPETAGTDCPSAILVYQGAYRGTTSGARVVAVRVRGSRATAIGPLQEMARLVKKKGRWRLTFYGH